MNGFEATEYIRKTMKLTLPIIALTADVTTVDLEKCKAVGMNDYIAKPIDERVLFRKILGMVKKKPILFDDLKNKEMSNQIKYSKLDYLNRLTKSNPVLMMEMISLYLEQTPALIHVMQQSCESKNWEILQSTVHKMIASFSIMGIAIEFENMAKKIQENARNRKDTNETKLLVADLADICLKVCIELKVEENRLKKSIEIIK